MKGHFNRVVLVPITPYEEKPVTKREPFDRMQANKFATVCEIWGVFEWGVSEITKVDGMNS